MILKTVQLVLRKWLANICPFNHRHTKQTLIILPHIILEIRFINVISGHSTGKFLGISKTPSNIVETIPLNLQNYLVNRKWPLY